MSSIHRPSDCFRKQRFDSGFARPATLMLAAANGGSSLGHPIASATAATVGQDIARSGRSRLGLVNVAQRPATATESPPAEPSSISIPSFLASWRLFHNSYCVGWLVGLMLPGRRDCRCPRPCVHRRGRFTGVHAGHCPGPLHERRFSGPPRGQHPAAQRTWFCCDSFQITMAVTFSVLAALSSRADRAKRESHEAIPAGYS